MNRKKIGKALLFPHIAIRLGLIPVSAVLLVYALLFLEPISVLSIISYLLSAYVLTVWCMQIPKLILLLRTFRDENKYARRWQDDTRLRMNVSLYGSLLWNTAYAVLQLGMGLWHRTFWFLSMAGYYLSLAVMRFALVRYTSKRQPGEKMPEELRKYRACGIVLLVMNLALSLMIFFMVYWGRTFHHHEITTIAMAAYTFTSFVFAILNHVKYRKSNSPVYRASKAISLAAACVSMLTLESTMLTTFGDGTMDPLARKIMLGVSGGVISVLIILMALYMIIQGTKKIKLIYTAKEQSNGKEE